MRTDDGSFWFALNQKIMCFTSLFPVHSERGEHSLLQLVVGAGSSLLPTVKLL